MNEIEILEYAFNKYCQIINNYNTKIDTMFLTTYENKYKNNLIEFFEKIKKETGLIFDSEEIYIMLENEIKKSIENLQNSIEEINQNLINQGHECLNNNYSFQYDMIGRISDDLIKNNQDRANSYSITNINEKFISYFIDSLYTQNSFINRTMLDKIEKELYYYIENTLKKHFK